MLTSSALYSTNFLAHALSPIIERNDWHVILTRILSVERNTLRLVVVDRLSVRERLELWLPGSCKRAPAQ